MHIGLLEDDIAIQEMLLLVLQDEGYTVTVYTRGEECLAALESLARTAPNSISVDLMIIDWRLGGGLSGVEVINRIRALSPFSSLPIILTTAALDDSDELEGLNVAMLEKPFSVDEIALLIEKLLGTSTS